MTRVPTTCSIFGDNDKVGMPPGWLRGQRRFHGDRPSDLYFVDINDTYAGGRPLERERQRGYGARCLSLPVAHSPAGYDQVDYHPDLWVGRGAASAQPRGQILR
ncbi:MAG: hypothetical protein M0C28_15660 [Candidatus Moduliflexus flocculans]|nr:hypothetical protein [Candidatus Moduliflexus flocculans]